MFGLGKLQLIGIGAALAGFLALGIFAWIQHHELISCQRANASVVQAEKDTTARAKREQARADAAALAQQQAINKQDKDALATAKQKKAQLEKQNLDLKRKLANVYANSPKARAWGLTPIPPAILRLLNPRPNH